MKKFNQSLGQFKVSKRRVTYFIPAMLFIVFVFMLTLFLVATNKEKQSHTPPWIYGDKNARFTVVEYADLECPGCQAYFQPLKNWINQNADVNLQWHHFPLAIHEPVAIQKALIAQCAGEVAGNNVFWQTVEQLYERPANAIPEFLADEKEKIEACIQSEQANAYIQEQLAKGNQEGITATPSLKIIDNQTQKSIVLSGLASDEELLSAIDYVVLKE
ncbi:DsbA family protein [Zophobihabitans entericus]|uniref:Thioredoxin domain-containing protein n=1 Tax=Zophobihabitans entericus TaxID=1635327 RepID=A0A6G9IB48_9GAMM|nr:DsbA family protein [Zophobihabitans entericus]QIQ21458.1 thioredoxin domain-containing protein [Zophobihabitans entericus]